ncbi:MAG: tyrosine-type recombinase/integrase [Schwartzia sp.]|nr:tyrosine-type recombinase/integrase [Schwartzia sp. (in: firmicutes)]
MIFTMSRNTPLSPRNMERAWRIIVEATEVPYRNFHILRHTNATDLLAKGISIVEVARRLGHSRISHTLELYGHAIPPYGPTIVRQIEALYTFTNAKNEN